MAGSFCLVVLVSSEGGMFKDATILRRGTMSALLIDKADVLNNSIRQGSYNLEKAEDHTRSV